MNTNVMPSTALQDFRRYLSTGEDPGGTIAEDLVAEMRFPHTSFVVNGKAEFDRVRDGASDQPWQLDVITVESTDSGFLAVIDIATTHLGQVTRSSTVSLVTVDAEQITHLAHWCTGAL